jgi:hypothetical protein
MRTAAIVYSVLVIWMSGWLTSTFGFFPALFAAIILGLPPFFAWRVSKPGYAAKRREFVYLAIASILSIAASTFLLTTWYGAGINRLVIFEREYQAFRREVAAIPEFANVNVSYTHRKGGRVYLHGTVASEYSHSRLIKMVEEMIRYGDSGYYDGVYYPGKKTPTNPDTEA